MRIALALIIVCLLACGCNVDPACTNKDGHKYGLWHYRQSEHWNTFNHYYRTCEHCGWEETKVK